MRKNVGCVARLGTLKNIIVKDLESNQMYRMPKETFQMFKRK